MQTAAIVIATATTLVALALVVRTAAHIVRVVRLGQPAVGRTDQPGQRLATTLRETFGHTRMLQWGVVGAAHWFVFIGFGALLGTLVEAYGELVDLDYDLPLIGNAWWYGAVVDFIAATTLAGILVLIAIRLANLPARLGRASRFMGSTFWQAYYVEATVLVIAILVLALRGLEAVHDGVVGSWSVRYLLAEPIGRLFDGLSADAAGNLVLGLATTKIVVSMAWFLTIALNATMGVAWHRFTAFPNVFFKRKASGAPSLGALQPMYSRGQPVNFEDPDEDDIFGVGAVEDFTWKGLLDFTTCTECGRCQSQCPAWATAKPLSPKLFVLSLRDHAYAKAPGLLGLLDGGAVASDPVQTDDKASVGPRVGASREEAERPLVGSVEDGGVIDPDVLWSCTTCGACVHECPVDIEHVDHIADLRRHQVLVQSDFPSELSGLFKNLERAGNPWGLPASSRLDWTEDLPVELKVIGDNVADLSEVDWLLWVGCAGAFDDRARKTTRAVAELLDIAGVDFAVLGGETCTGDPARRAGNEFLFQMLAQENVESLREARAVKVVATCAHCFNTVKNEYPQLGLSLEVVHHTQLLNRLVRDGRLRPLPPPVEMTGGDSGGHDRSRRSVTYHDPCYLGRHNQVYSPPRELIGALPDVSLREMPRTGERSFCCGAGGARMWMEERIGTRINTERTREALDTGASQIAVACPYCYTMLGDAVTTAKSEGRAADDVEVLDVAQMLLAAVKRGRVG